MHAPQSGIPTAIATTHSRPNSWDTPLVLTASSGNAITQGSNSQSSVKSPDNNGRDVSSSRQQKKAKNSLLIKCYKEGTTPELSEIRDAAISNGIPVSNVYVTSNNNTVVSVPNPEALSKLKPLLAAQSSMKRYEISNVRDKLPRISVIDLDEKFDETEFVETLKLQNPEVATLINNGENISDFYIKKSSNKQNLFQVNITVTENIRKLIRNRGNRLYIGLRSCRVVDKLNVVRCYKCHDHNHLSNRCVNNERCGYCSSYDHTSDNCNLKTDLVNNKSHLNCVNCERNNLPSSGHSVYWPNCPSNKKYREEAIKRLAGNSGGLNSQG